MTAHRETLRRLLLPLLLLHGLLLARPPKPVLPYDPKLLKQEPPEISMGDPSFNVSSRLRGMMGLNGVVLWVSSDRQSLLAYEGSRLLWKTNVVAACPRISGPHEIRTIVSQSSVHVIFFCVGDNTCGEIERKTGKVISTTGVRP